MRITKMEKDKIFYEENGLITLQQGMEVEDLMLYGWGLTNDSSVKFTSSSGGFGDKCKDDFSKYEEKVSLRFLKISLFLKCRHLENKFYRQCHMLSLCE